MKITDRKTLCDGTSIPVVGAGFWQVSREDATRVAKEALEVGYRHLDDAAAYGNEREVGLGIKESGISRDQIYVTTKIPAEFKSYAKAQQSINDSLKRLDLDYLDLILIHAPRPWPLMWTGADFDRQNLEVYQAMLDAKKEGKVGSIGVSNFSTHDLTNILEHFQEIPVVNQIAVYAGNTPKDLIDFCEKKGIVVEAYSPLATGKILKKGELKDMAKKYGVSVPQLAIKYTLQLGTVSLPKTTHKEYLESNSHLDFEISHEDMSTLLSLGKR